MALSLFPGAQHLLFDRIFLCIYVILSEFLSERRKCLLSRPLLTCIHFLSLKFFIFSGHFLSVRVSNKWQKNRKVSLFPTLILLTSGSIHQAHNSFSRTMHSLQGNRLTAWLFSDTAYTSRTATFLLPPCLTTVQESHMCTSYYQYAGGRIFRMRAEKSYRAFQSGFIFSYRRTCDRYIQIPYSDKSMSVFRETSGLLCLVKP